MSKGGKEKDVFEVGRIRQIIELMKQHDLSEVDLQQGDEKIKLCRGSAGPPVNAAPVAIAPASASTAPPPPAPTDTDDEAGTITINSPMVGTFYARPNPESQPFVKVGDSVDEDTVVCIVEAMKVFNEIPAECSGEIVQVLVKDQEPVDHGKPLFRVRPNG